MSVSIQHNWIHTALQMTSTMLIGLAQYFGQKITLFHTCQFYNKNHPA